MVGGTKVFCVSVHSSDYIECFLARFEHFIGRICHFIALSRHLSTRFFLGIFMVWFGY